MKPTWIRKAHRWVGLLFSLSILMSAGSGVLHNVMSRTQAPPPSARPGASGLDVSKVAVTVAEAAAKLPAEAAVQAVNLRGIGGEPWYQIYTSGTPQPNYVSAVDGRVDEAQDERYAAEIASKFFGGATARKTDYLTAFNGEYINIFRILPVYRFDFDDEMQTRVYVSTTTGSVTRHTDKQRQFQADAFSTFHKLSFIPNKDVRDLVLTVMTGGIFVVSLLGVALFFLTRPRRKS